MLIKWPFLWRVRIFRIYVTVSTAVQQAIRHDIHPLVRNIGMHSPILLGLLREYPDGSEGLALKCVWDLLDRGTKPTKELIGTWRNAYLERNMGPRCIIPILPHLEKQETLSYLPTVFGLLPTENSDRSKEYSVLKDLIVRLCSPASEGEKPLISPAEIMIAIHNMEESIGLKRMVCRKRLRSHVLVRD